jgi:uncharacterized protein (TIGR01244 family)
MAQQLDEKTLVSAQIRPEDVAAFHAQGVRTIINNRPDGEEPDQPLAADIERAAHDAGMTYRFIPIVRGMGPADVEAMSEAIDQCEGKVLAYCRSGTRSALAWAVASARSGVPRAEIERKADAAGVDISLVSHLL